MEDRRHVSEPRCARRRPHARRKVCCGSGPFATILAARESKTKKSPPWTERVPSAPSRIEAWVCFLLAAAVFLPYWSDSVLPIHDSLFKYQFFNFAYSEMIAVGDIPMWVPYGSYGLAAILFQMTTLTPAHYLVGAVGVAVGAGNTVLLFKTGVFLEVMLYAAGLLLLARAVYERTLSRLIVIFGGICLLSWLYQPFLNFYTFYLFPYLLLFLFAFLRTGEPAKLWLAACAALLSLVGATLYFAALYLFVLTVLCVVALAAGGRPLFRHGLKRWLLRWEAGAAVALGAILAAGVALGVQETITIAAGRDSASSRVPLDVFLEYGRLTKLTMVSGFLSGTVTHAPNTYYIGLLPPVLFALGLLRLRHPLFLGVAAAAASLVWLSFGGFFSTAAYYFPLMAFFRHIGLTFGLCGFLLLVASGWVVDALHGPSSGTAAETGAMRRQRLIILIVMALMLFDLYVSWRPGDGSVAPTYNAGLLFLIPLRVAAYFAAMAAVWLHLRGRGHADTASHRVWAPIVAAYVFDIGSYQASVLLTMPRTESPVSANAFAPDTLPYRATRTDTEIRDTAPGWKRALVKERTTSYRNTALYSFTYTFLGLDPCYPRLRGDIWQRRVYDALVARGGRPHQWPRDDFLPRRDPNFVASLGCGAPKVALVGSYVAAASSAQARELLKSNRDPRSELVVEAKDGADGASPTSGVAGEAQVVRFSANRVEVDVVNRADRPAWLYYADAYHSGWRARVDGAEAAVARANVGFKAVRVPPGRHTVVLTFGEGLRRAITWLLALTSAAACLAASIAVAGAVRRNG